MNAATKLRTALALGLGNISAVATYRFLLKVGLHPVQRAKAELPTQPFFIEPLPGRINLNALTGLGDTSASFGWMQKATSEAPPNWHMNAINNILPQGTLAPWWTLPDFDGDTGDIKGIWDASRLQWMFGFCAAAARREPGAIEKLNSWLLDWCRNNPPYLGRNWKCGQEASLRVLHMAMVAVLLGQEHIPSRPLIAFIEAHLNRIIPTLAYASAQDNNHGTSETAAVFVGGSWLQSVRPSYESSRVAELGRRRLEERALSLVADDGSFSQYSMVYHRMLLDTFSISEIWRRAMDVPKFSDLFYNRAKAASRWLLVMMEPNSGLAPNIGANDGTRLLPVTQTGYRDFRPSVALATALFSDEKLGGYDGGILELFGLNPKVVASIPDATLFDKGGFAVIRSGCASLILRYPRFRFRPSQCDALHVDLWLRDENWLRDGGTFSYAASPPDIAYFGGVCSHNTVQFDGREQMPRLGRFLFGDWLRVEERPAIVTDGEGLSLVVGYRNRMGAHHQRKIYLAPDRLCVEDNVSGFSKEATLRWRLKPSRWEQVGDTFRSGEFAISIRCSAPTNTTMVEGEESLYYLQKSKLPVIETTVAESALVVTEFTWPR